MKRVLVIDDDFALLELIRRWLESADYEAVLATRVSEGLDNFRKTPFDLVVTDVFLPDRNGTGFLMEIREEFPKTKVFVMSGGGGRIDYLQFASLLGATKILYKPLERLSFIKAVQAIMH